VGILLLVATVFALVLTFTGLGALGLELGRTIADKLVCIVSGDDECGADTVDELAVAYGPELALAAHEHVPEIRFEDADFVSLPVDPRDCRTRECADTSARGALDRSFEGAPATAFVRVVDCREGGEPPAGADCTGERARNLYLQYWLYYPDSATKPFGEDGYHLDDWESYQVRVNADGTVDARASSHGSYNYEPEAVNLSDIGKADDLLGTGLGPDFREAAWGDANGYLWVSAGSHAGRAAGDDDFFRSVPREVLRLIPIEPNTKRIGRLDWDGITPPWEKPVYSDPEDIGT
jgi:hypothetical protein